MTLPLPIPPASLPDQNKHAELITALQTYKREADENRRTGLNPRDQQWTKNLDLYWNRTDFSTKANWQSQNTMPEVPSYVDRFAAALKEALVATPNGFYEVHDPYDTEGDVSQSIKNMTDTWLSTVGRNQVGTPLDFSAVFEEQMKLGALMATSAVVLWRDDVPGGRVSMETVDPRMVWLDHTYRNLYRIRRTEIDRTELGKMAQMTSSKGKPLFNLEEINRLVGSLLEDDRIKRELTGSGSEIVSDRKPIVFDEYIASVMGSDGKMLMEDEVVVLANDNFLVRGPEKNPFTHGRDWLLYTPLVTVPLSPYGRSYMEDFGSIAKVFTDLTNLLLDATQAASMNAFAMVPAMLTDPTQVNTGIHPNKIFLLEEGYTAEEFAKSIELGKVDPMAFNVWQNLKSELSEAAGMNEIGLGQLPDKTHISATAVAGAQQSSSAILRSVAQTVETRFLNPGLDLIWKTGLQHARADDMRLANAVGPEMYAALIGRKNELIKRPITFQARGISGLIQRQQRLQALLQIMQVIGANENLTAAFMQRVDINKLVNLLFQLSNVDLQKMEISQRQRMVQQVAQPMMQAGQNGSPTAPAGQEMGNVAAMMGVAA